MDTAGLTATEEKMTGAKRARTDYTKDAIQGDETIDNAMDVENISRKIEPTQNRKWTMIVILQKSSRRTR